MEICIDVTYIKFTPMASYNSDKGPRNHGDVGS